jgi:UDP-N-acetylmuramoyl-L-alanyl-D-glutamate--2,6-diaminopimelate ligase
MQLSQLFPTLLTDYDRTITGLSLDSREIQPGNLFFAVSGTQTQGQRFIQDAIHRGAVAIVQETVTPQFERLSNNIPCFGIPQLSEQIGVIAAQFYHYPSQSLRVIGVTGTNGKTSVSHFIAYLFHTLMNKPCGLLGTLGYGVYGQLHAGQHTTPSAILLQSLFAQLKAQNVRNVVMEVSSHALAQGRVNGVQFDTAVLTNLTRDHLDYHQTMTAYANAKKRLFFMSSLKTAVINWDCDFGRELLKELPTTVTPLTYSLEDQRADVYAHQCQRH